MIQEASMDMKEVTAIFDQLSEMVEKRDTEIKFRCPSGGQEYIYQKLMES